MVMTYQMSDQTLSDPAAAGSETLLARRKGVILCYVTEFAIDLLHIW